MEFALTDEQRRLQSLARDFAYREVRPRARSLDKEVDPRNAYPEDLVRRASELGLRTIKLPKEYGGLGIDMLTEVIIFEELCAGDVGFGTTIAHPWREGRMLAEATTPDQRERYLPDFLADPTYMTALAMTEPTAGSDHSTPYSSDLGAGAQMTAVLSGEEWILNGRKHFITAGNVAKLLFVLARTDPSVPWVRGVSLFLVPSNAPEFRVAKVQDKLGIRVNPNTELVFDDCRVPAGNLVGRRNGGLEVLKKYAAGSKTKEGVKSLGIARAAYEEAVLWARDRRQGGKKLVEHPAIAHTLVDMATRIELCRSLIWRAAWCVDYDEEHAPKLEGMAKLAATSMAAEVAVKALEVFGGYGILRENHIEKLARDAIAMLHAFVGNHAMRENLSGILSREAVPLQPFTMGEAA